MFPKISISRFLSCCRNPGFGETCGRARTICPSATLSVMPRLFMRYAATTVGEREIPAEQWTRILPVASLDLRDSSMIVQAESQMLDIEEDGESVSGMR